MALIDIYTLQDGKDIPAIIEEHKGKTIWKCGSCKNGNLATATDWEDIEIRENCSRCRRKIIFNILGK